MTGVEVAPVGLGHMQNGSSFPGLGLFSFGAKVALYGFRRAWWRQAKILARFPAIFR